MIQIFQRAMPSRGLQRTVLLALLALSSGCSSGETEPIPPQPAACEEHELALPDGSCIRPGVPPDGCAEGFVHDGVYGCEPILPAESCPPGLMAVPGEDTCRAVMECGQEPWGDLPVDGTTQYVDGAYAGGDADGSEAKPWPTIGEAVTAAAPGALIAVAAGSYSENVLIVDKPVRLWGRCPDQVAIEATGQPAYDCPLAAVCILEGADGSEVGGLALHGAGHGLALSGSEDVLVDRVRLHDNAGWGIDAEGVLGPTSIDVRDLLIEQNHEYGLLAVIANVTVDRSVVRSTLPRTSDQQYGRGIYAARVCFITSTGMQCDSVTPLSARVTGSLIEHNHDAGVFLGGLDGTVDGSVVRGTLPRVSDQQSGRGIDIEAVCSEMQTEEQCDSTTGTTASVTRSLIENNHDVGLFAMGSDITLDGSVVRGTLPCAFDQGHGPGLITHLGWMTTPAGRQWDLAKRGSASVTHSLIEQNHQMGVLVYGSEATVDATVVRATLPRASDQRYGHGISVQPICLDASTGQDCHAAAPSSAQVTRSLIEQNYEFGLLVVSSDATVDASVVRATLPGAFDGLFGDGFAVASEAEAASVTMANLLIADSARAGVGSFGASVSLADTHIRCAAFPLAGDPFRGRDFEIADHGGNLCGCPAANSTCKLVSAELEPPVVLPANE